MVDNAGRDFHLPQLRQTFEEIPPSRTRSDAAPVQLDPRSLSELPPKPPQYIRISNSSAGVCRNLVVEMCLTADGISKALDPWISMPENPKSSDSVIRQPQVNEPDHLTNGIHPDCIGKMLLISGRAGISLSMPVHAINVHRHDSSRATRHYTLFTWRGIATRYGSRAGRALDLPSGRAKGYPMQISDCGFQIYRRICCRLMFFNPQSEIHNLQCRLLL
ncbi:MAG: hypothetical protein WBD07_12820 [Vicinamibacterales bacterium]